MRTFDLSPLYRATVGFDQIADLMDRVLTTDVAAPNYPPYNIEKTADDGWRISIAVAGFSDSELSVEVRENALIVAARKAEEETPRRYLHRGIATRAFERRFHLADHVRVTGATMWTGCCMWTSCARCPRRCAPAGSRLPRPPRAKRNWSRPSRSTDRIDVT